MKKLSLVSALMVFISPLAYAQSLTNQIDAVRAVQEQNEETERADMLVQQQAERAYEQHAAAAQKVEAQRREQYHAVKVQEEKQKEAAILADKKREQDYQDKLRELDLQEKSLRVEQQKAHVARENDYIDQELNEKEAKTDVIQSEADATRDLSSGTKSLLEKTGDAEVKKESGLFSK